MYIPEFTCVGICILNYNNGLKTVKCIESILNQTFREYRIIVIDNNSNDDSLSIITSFLKTNKLSSLSVKNNSIQEALKENFPPVVLIESDVNGGYSYGNNLGINLAKFAGIFTNLLIINNDLVLQPGFLAEITNKYNTLRKELNSGKIALGATELNQNGKVTHRGFHYLNIPTGLCLNFPLFPSFRYIVGSCIFTNIDAPLMDESFFLYYDDTQYSKILLKNHYSLDASVNAMYFHEVGATTKKDPVVYKIVYQSTKRFYRLNYPLFLVPAILIRMPVNYLRTKIAYTLKNLFFVDSLGHEQ
jgi:hypothetical protein